MTLDEAIKRTEEIAEENQRVVDTGIVFDDVTIDMLYCDDTEVIEEHLSNYQRCAEEHRQLTKWLKELKQLKEQEPCEDVISRAELIEALNTWDKFGYAPTNELIPLRGNVDKDKYVPYIHYDDVIKCIKGMPPVTPQPKIGHWNSWFTEIKGNDTFNCMECGSTFIVEQGAHNMNYCPNCGTDMRGEV